MIIPDINLLLYAYNPQSAQHQRAKEWWRETMNQAELVGMPHEVVFGFLRIATNSRLGPAAVEFSAGERVVRQWMQRPQVRMLLPDAEHANRVLRLMSVSGSRGAVISDAVLASYAVANRATLCSSDSDFARFPGLDWRNPLKE